MAASFERMTVPTTRQGVGDDESGTPKGWLLAPRIYNRDGGVQTYLRLVVRALGEGKRLRDVLVLSDDTADGLPDAQRFGHRFVGSGHSRARFVFEAARRAREEAWVLVGHVRQAPLAHFLRRLAGGSPYGVIVHGVEVWEPLTRGRRAALEAAAVVVCTTPYTAERIQAHNNVAPERIRVLPLTVDPDRFHLPVSPVEPDRRAEQSLTLLTVSRLSLGAPDKGVDHTIEAVALLAKKGLYCRYIVVGDGDDRPRLEAMAQRLGVTDRVVFRGRIDDAELSMTFESADVFVLPSKREGFGLVLLEAMQYGLPLLVTPEGGIQHVLREGENGLGVPYGSPDTIVVALQRLTNRPFRMRLGATGQSDFETRFSYTAFKQRLLAIVEGIAGT